MLAPFYSADYFTMKLSTSITAYFLEYYVCRSENVINKKVVCITYAYKKLSNHMLDNVGIKRAL